jgi:ABC-2 type transport system ATP-binding protein
MRAIEVRGLTKVYRPPYRPFADKGAGKLAVDNISFDVEKGEIFGLLGPNGAGKTTTIKMLATLLLPTSGSALVLDNDVSTGAKEIRKRINLVTGGERGVYYRITGRENLRFFADLYRVPIGERDAMVDRLLDLVGLTDAADVRVEDYSRGMKQRLHIARGLVNDPEILFLDEPTIGLDPEIARDIRNLVKRMSREGRTILLTTHDMREADILCDRIGLLSHGRLVALGTPDQLKGMVKRRSILEAEVRGTVPASTVEAIKATSGVLEVCVIPNSTRTLVRVQVQRGGPSIGEMTTLLSDLDLEKVSSEEPTLEDAYISLVSKDGVE